MARNPDRFACQQCGAVQAKWAGRCESCGAWNSIVEETPRARTPKGLSRGKGRKLAFSNLTAEVEDVPRIATGIAEFDRVVGGGLVPGSALLIGGDPGIGKSTLLLQAVSQLGLAGRTCCYISGEEAVAQVAMRARRLGLGDAPVQLAASNDVRDILTSLGGDLKPAVLVIDSIQTMFIDNLDSAPGTVAQVRGSAQELIRHAKETGTAVLLVGHVTKDGQIAGPRVLEHMVDTVLYFEGERGHQFRILRSVKNRFGPANEIGVFEMQGGGLVEIANPSALFLANRAEGTSGSAVFAGIEGSRPLLVEIQALVAPSPLATPRRAVVGWDSGRLAMVLAVLEARCGVSLSGSEIYLNVAGGMRITEPAADLAVAAALVSAASDRPFPGDTVVFGEIGLAGEIRPAAQTETRLKEAAKLGFENAYIPAGAKVEGPTLQIRDISHLQDLVELYIDGAPSSGYAGSA